MSMFYEIQHVTTCEYDATVTSSRCTLRMLPRNDRGQKAIQSGIIISPEPEEQREHLDFFGNRIVNIRIESSHRELQVGAHARVEVDRPNPPVAALTPNWEAVQEQAAASMSIDPLSPVHYIYPSRFVPLHATVTNYVRKSFIPERPVLEAGLELIKRIKADFGYDPGSSEVSTPLIEAFDARHGVCQDFAHIMIAGLRGLGLPTAYVSGYLRTLPPPGKPRLEGADATHAWVSLWCGPEFGWIDLDPTNAVAVVDDHIAVAIGRDYADVSPIDGVILGSGGQKLSIEVDVVPITVA
jgi:transglutaminase-like putative cysteine protease